MTSPQQALAQPTPSSSYVQSFARGLAVIRSFDAQTPAQTLTAVAQKTGLTRAGARRILHTLLGLGYVEQDGRLFRLTAKVLDLGFAYLSSLPFWNLAEPFMESLVRDVQESSSAAVLDGDDIVYVLRVPTEKIIAINLGVGSRLPAYCSSLGRMLLSALPDHELGAHLDRVPLVRRTIHTVTDPAELRERILQVRHQGWALVDEELEDGLLSLAAPIYGRQGKMLAAINIGAHKNRISVQYMQARILPRLLQTARQISERVALSAI